MPRLVLRARLEGKVRRRWLCSEVASAMAANPRVHLQKCSRLWSCLSLVDGAQHITADAETKIKEELGSMTKEELAEYEACARLVSFPTVKTCQNTCS